VGRIVECRRHLVRAVGGSDDQCHILRYRMRRFQSLAGEFGVSLDNHEHVAKFESAAIGELSSVFYRVGERRVVH
jgi:hypothetical protein